MNVRTLAVVFAMLVAIGCWREARADWTVHFILVGCDQKDRVLDLEYRPTNNSIADAVTIESWRRIGFRDIGDVEHVCKLDRADYDRATYKIIAGRGDISQGMCGAAPAAYLTLYRNDKILVNRVTFGDNCGDAPAILRLTIVEKGVDLDERGNLLRLPAELEVCFKSDGTLGQDKPAKRECTPLGDKWDELFPLNDESLARFEQKLGY